ncbi:CLUMA_CG021175, isoform A [Clunio marinus]|uniref:CLUMA_CG021175, isoform A n=1 Tax=Clunio marinus TaxID=568069 RepID=A0A1J1J6A5_9DIPT|nr:CLUMA_CG021175, isoform A [Clunio marinus]
MRSKKKKKEFLNRIQSLIKEKVWKKAAFKQFYENLSFTYLIIIQDTTTAISLMRFLVTLLELSDEFFIESPT